MRTVIAGGHGQIALRLSGILRARGEEPVGLIRRPEYADDLRAVGAEPLLLDLEAASVGEVASALKGAGAVVFAAGAGPELSERFGQILHEVATLSHPDWLRGQASGKWSLSIR